MVGKYANGLTAVPLRDLVLFSPIALGIYLCQKFGYNVSLQISSMQIMCGLWCFGSHNLMLFVSLGSHL